MFLVAWLGILLTVVSLCLYGSAASHFYSLALEKKSEGDIPAHKLYLQKIFKFIKTDFVFYSISFTFIATIVSVNLLLSLMTGGFLFGGNLTISPDSLNINFTFLIVIGILVFIAAAVTCIILSVKLYKKLMNKYYNLTGETYIKSAYKEAKDSLYRK